MLQRMSIKVRILSILGILAVGYLALLAMVQVSATVTHSRMARISSSLWPAALQMQVAESGFERMKKHYGDAVVLQDGTALTGADKDADAVTAALTAVKLSLAADPALAGHADFLVSQFAAVRSNDKETYSAVLAAKDAPSEALMARMSGLGNSNKDLAEAMSAFDKTIAANFQNQLDTVDAWSLRSKLTGAVMFVFAGLSCAAAWWVVQFKVVRPLHSLAVRIQDIAEGEGDLTRRVEVSGRNEIDEVGIWFNVFLDKLQDVMRKVKANTLRLTAASEELTMSATRMAQGAEAQQGQTAMVAASMHEMSATVLEVSHNSNTAALKTRQAAEDADQGGRVVEQTIAMMRSVTESVDQVARQIVGLGERSNQVGKVVELIDEIAGRTNLLALNAAIEAARAGEQGRGFAVVAGEVRNLAERTAKATREIGAMIGAIQEETKAAAIAMGQGTVQVRKGVTATGEAGVMLKQIIDGAQEAAGMVNQIAAAATEQTSTTDEVNITINEIAKISDETAAGARKSARACVALSELATDLNSLISKFRVEEDLGAGQSGSQSRSNGGPLVSPGFAIRPLRAASAGAR
jgi:methyl-accepting chemotaxis protein